MVGDTGTHTSLPFSGPTTPDYRSGRGTGIVGSGLGPTVGEWVGSLISFPTTFLVVQVPSDTHRSSLQFLNDCRQNLHN